MKNTSLCYFRTQYTYNSEYDNIKTEIKTFAIGHSSAGTKIAFIVRGGKDDYAATRLTNPLGHFHLISIAN